MEHKTIIGKEIYPDLETLNTELIDTMLKEHGVSVDFLFDDGVEFTWDDETLTTKNYPGDISFYKTSPSGVTELELTYIESWEKLIFLDKFENEILTINIYSNVPSI